MPSSPGRRRGRGMGCRRCGGQGGRCTFDQGSCRDGPLACLDPVTFAQPGAPRGPWSTCWASGHHFFPDWLHLVEAPISTTLDVRDLEKNASKFTKMVVRRKFACFSPSVPCPLFPNRGVLTKIIDVPTLASNANPSGKDGPQS